MGKARRRALATQQLFAQSPWRAMRSVGPVPLPAAVVPAVREPRVDEAVGLVPVVTRTIAVGRIVPVRMAVAIAVPVGLRGARSECSRANHGGSGESDRQFA